PGLATSAVGQTRRKTPIRPDEQETARKTVIGPDEQKVIDLVQVKARNAGLGPLSHQVSKHFLSVGDAPAGHQAQALERCEKLATVFLTYFQEHGFKVAFPQNRMTVIALKDKSSYRAYLGEDVPENVGGHYDPESNQLVVFDFRSQQEDLAAQA